MSAFTFSAYFVTKVYLILTHSNFIPQVLLVKMIVLIHTVHTTNRTCLITTILVFFAFFV